MLMPREQRSYLPPLRSRQEYFDFLNGYAVQRVEEIQAARIKKPLVKTFLLETLRDGPVETSAPKSPLSTGPPVYIASDRPASGSLRP
jgi:hypothetical protein